MAKILDRLSCDGETIYMHESRIRKTKRRASEIAVVWFLVFLVGEVGILTEVADTGIGHSGSFLRGCTYYSPRGMRLSRGKLKGGKFERFRQKH